MAKYASASFTDKKSSSFRFRAAFIQLDLIGALVNLHQQSEAALRTHVALGIALALSLTRGITSRLGRLSENTVRLAAGKPLLARLEGSDEIAALDQVIH